MGDSSGGGEKQVCGAFVVWVGGSNSLKCVLLNPMFTCTAVYPPPPPLRPGLCAQVSRAAGAAGGGRRATPASGGPALGA